MARLITLADVGTELGLSESQVYALVRSQDLPAVKIGGRGVWHVERIRLEAWLNQRHEDTAEWIQQHPFPDARADPPAQRAP